MQRVAGDPQRRQRAHVAAVVDRKPQRSGPHLGGDGWRLHLVVDQRQGLALLGRLALDVDEMRGMRHRLEHDDELGRQLHRDLSLLAGAKFDRVDGDLLQDLFEAGFRQVDPGAPERLAEVFPHRQRVRIVRRNPAHARADGEGDLDHLVERRLVGLRTQRAVVGLLVHRLELQAGVEHAAAAGAQHVPVQLEQAEPRGVQEGADDFFFVETALGGKCQHVDAAQMPVLAVADQRLDRGENIRIGRIAKRAEQGLRVVHGAAT